ncbi:unnamed protein product [Heterobilharzia americana]|nr:unnamed protein product [Heterobilharzia americana]
MPLINSNKLDGDGNVTGNMKRNHLGSPSLSSSVSSEDLLIWSREGNDLDCELFSISPPYEEELSRVHSPLLNSEYAKSFTPLTNRNEDDDSGASASTSNNGTIYSSNSNNHNFDCLTTIQSSPPYLSSSTSKSSLCYVNGLSHPESTHSMPNKMTKSSINGAFPSSAFSTPRTVTNYHVISSSNFSEQRNATTLADDFIDLDIKNIPPSNVSVSISCSSEVDCINSQNPPERSSSSRVNGQIISSLDLSVSHDATVQATDSNLFQPTETGVLRQCYHKPFVNGVPTSQIVGVCSNSLSGYTDYAYTRNNKLFPCQSSNPLPHLPPGNESDEDVMGYSFPSSSSSSASSCIHLPPPCNNNYCHQVDHTENNSLLVSSVHRNNDGSTYHGHHLQCLRQDSGLIPFSLFQSIPRPIMLIPTGDLASGDSLTCTVVNILRGLGLLDRCGVEDLCAMNSLFKSLMYPTCWESRAEDTMVTRSSSFTSCTLVNTRRSTVPGEHYERNRILFKCGSKPLNGSCLVSYLLSCSYMGTSFLVPHSIYDSGNIPAHCCIRPSTGCCHFVIDRTYQTLSCNTPTVYLSSLVQPIYNSTMNWRRGCSDNLVLMLTHHNPGSKSSPSVVDKLLTGRFFPGPFSWRSVWPFTHEDNPTYFDFDESKNSKASNTLALWFSAWLHCGAVPVLAQLYESIHPSEQCDISDSPSHYKSLNHSSQELVWCHRLIYGVTENNEVYLTNPNEIVPAQFVLDQLCKQTELRITKAQISICGQSITCTRSCMLIETIQQVVKKTVSCKATFFTGESLTLLARHPDPRWASMNIMGQVLCALRSLERWADNLELSATSSDSTNHQPALFTDASSSVSFNRTNSTEMEQFSTPQLLLSRQLKFLESVFSS